MKIWNPGGAPPLCLRPPATFRDETIFGKCPKTSEHGNLGDSVADGLHASTRMRVDGLHASTWMRVDPFCFLFNILTTVMGRMVHIMF